MAGVASGPVGSLGTVSSITVGKRVFTDLDNLKTLYGVTDNSLLYTSPRLANGSSAYAVPNLKTFSLEAIRIQVIAGFESGSSTAAINVGYCDNDLGIPSNTAPTSPVYIFGSASNGYGPVSMVLGSSGLPFIEVDIGKFIVPAGKFLFIHQALGVQSNYQFYGYEADV